MIKELKVDQANENLVAYMNQKYTNLYCVGIADEDLDMGDPVTLHVSFDNKTIVKKFPDPNAHIPRPRARWNISKRRRKKGIESRLEWAIGKPNDNHTRQLIDAVTRYYLRKVSSNTGKYRK